MLDPDIAFDDFKDKGSGVFQERYQDSLMSGFSSDLYAHMGLHSKAIEILDDNILEKKDSLTFRINFRKVNSITKLKDNFSEFLDNRFREFKQVKNGEKASPKRYKVDYNLLLMVGDMKERDGMTNKQIAKQLFPRDFKIENESANSESAERKVGQYYARYKELVAIGYGELTYP